MTALRWRSASIETAAATRIARTRIRRISFSTNGATKLVGQEVLRDEADEAAPRFSPASPIDSLASARASSLGSPSKPLPGAKTLAASRPSASATTVAVRK